MGTKVGWSLSMELMSDGYLLEVIDIILFLGKELPMSKGHSLLYTSQVSRSKGIDGLLHIHLKLKPWPSFIQLRQQFV